MIKWMYFSQILIAQPLLYLIETTASKQGRVWKTNFWNQPEVCARRFYLATCSFGFPSTISLALFIKPWRLKKIASQIFCAISLAYKALLSENCSGKITLHLLFGWSLDKDEKSLDQSKQFSWKFGSIQIKAIPNPDHPPLGIFWTYHFFCTKHKIIENEKWKLLHTLIVALELSLSKDIR